MWMLTGGRLDLDLGLVRRLMVEYGSVGPWRMVLRGAGDPLLFAGWRGVIDLARESGASHVSLETDLLVSPAELSALAGVDLLSVHIPAATAATYATVMGVDGFHRVMDNLARLIAHGQRAEAPRIVPMLVKCRGNVAEVEPWRRAWLDRLGTAVVVGEDAFARAAGDLPSPPVRATCCGPELRVLADGLMTDELSRPVGRLHVAGALEARRLQQVCLPLRKEAA